MLQEVQQTVAEKTSALEAEAFKTKRMQEETAILKRKVTHPPSRRNHLKLNACRRRLQFFNIVLTSTLKVVKLSI